MNTIAPIPQAPVQAGDVLAGKYRVERILGIGGMGVVVAAHHLQLDEKVAIKFLLPEALASAETVGRFAREARAAVKIKSEHVARVIDVGELPNGSPYMVMEYLDGEDLADWLAKRGTVAVQQAVDFILQACEALAQAHALGIVHRDLKPGNLFCIRTPDGALSVKVLDFGISKLTSGAPEAQDMTRTASIVGSPQYMSPEQLMSSKSVDGRTDLWALGVILYELVTGRAPFEGESITELAIKIAGVPAPPLRVVRPDAPAALESAIARCLEKNREHRFADVAEFARAIAPTGTAAAALSAAKIEATLRREGATAPRASMPDAAESGASRAAVGSSTQMAAPVALPEWKPATGSAWASTGSSSRRSKWGFVAAGAAAVLAMGVAVWRLSSSGSSAKEDLKPSAASATLASAATQPSATTPTVLPTLPPAPTSLSVDALPKATDIAPSKPASTPRVSAPIAAQPATRPTAPRPTAPAASPPPPPTTDSKPNCDPPYYFDGKGNRVFKKECL